MPQIFAKFVSHHLSHGSVLADWPAGWNGWCLDELRFASTRRMRQGRAYIEGTTDADYLPNSNELTDEARRRIGWGYDKWGKKPK
ncbi:hypothetical protein [Sutterella sp.]|uniref:hypothetical protein n=1 Tax=Sutterella sp. TaxID=1981025 RepID=UPI0026DFA54D|nr:hypothetical protein [Sutterella sp.]MDO5531403.1 hypothetical protein [Sutterella sp.]